ncbi:MAG: hypothetical protein DRJ96_05690 [Thermoprotei archaeon]|nr:MAG: hypothetical protein DRJ67_11605 [Thermoprotei archaeon]RLE96767.1 MAG: hypothetical protein DRJ96_05690 [Thermoprotei archaeon]
MSEELELLDGRLHGIANTALVPELMAELGGVLGTVLGERAVVVTARDNYPPSRMLKRALSSGLMSTGITVIDFHAATTPELVFAIKRLGAKAGIQFTISPIERNGVMVKFFDSHGVEYSRERMEDLLERMKSGRIVRSLPSFIGWVTYAEYIHDIYSAAVVSYVDAPAIAGGGLKLVCDVNFGPSSEVLPSILSELGVESIFLNAHKPPAQRGVSHMPSPEAIEALGRIVKASGASLGAALCADATRALVVDDKGKPLTSEELAGILLSCVPRGARVALSESMGSLVDEVARERGVRLVRIRGSRHELLRAARRLGSPAVFTCGGEAAFTDFSFSFDGMLTIIKVMEAAAKAGEELSEMRSALPTVPVVRSSVRLRDGDYLKVVGNLHRMYKDSFLTMTGLRVRVGGVWVSVEARPGRIELVAEDTEGAKEAVEKMSKTVKAVIREVKAAQ